MEHLNLRNLPGVFISVEGPEFSGKTTYIKNCKETLNLNIKTTREPGATERGKILRDWVTNPIGAFSNNQNLRAMGFAMDRALHIHEVIKPSLEEGLVLITDRYIDSSYVLQGLIQGQPIEEINYVNGYANEVTDINNILPHKTIYVDISQETANERRKMRGDSNLMDIEFMEKFNQIRYSYLDLAKANKDRYIVIDGNGTIEEVTKVFNETILNIVQEIRPNLLNK